MSSGFVVDLGRMASLVETLTDVKDSMSEANDALKDASAQNLGSARLDDAGAAFRDKWTYGIGKLADLAQSMTEGLAQTDKAYSATEAELAQLFGTSSGLTGRLAGGAR